MTIKRVGFVGWRGMVGSVLLQRMREEGDFNLINEPIFLTTSQVNQLGPDIGKGSQPLSDASDLNLLKTLDAIITCQGSDYTKDIYPKLRNEGWNGYWIDAASSLRMNQESTIVLDPINFDLIKKSLHENKKDFIGGNCTVSCMLMGIGGLFKNNLVEWMTSMTYQAASGGGAQHMRELINQMGSLYNNTKNLLENPASAILDIDRQIKSEMNSNDFPKENFSVPLAGSLIPWIDVPMENGQSKEEWKANSEANKILGNTNNIPIDGTCVRIGAMRSHSQALTIKLKKDIPIKDIESIIQETSEWTKLIPNSKEETIHELSPAKVTGTMSIPVGRVRKMNIGNEYLNAFTVGDQLLWGAAEPLRRMLKIAIEHQ